STDRRNSSPADASRNQDPDGGAGGCAPCGPGREGVDTTPTLLAAAPGRGTVPAAFRKRPTGSGAGYGISRLPQLVARRARSGTVTRHRARTGPAHTSPPRAPALPGGSAQRRSIVSAKKPDPRTATEKIVDKAEKVADDLTDALSSGGD